MKIGEFAEQNQVTTKMLRHYDEMGLLHPAAIDPLTGYRSYTSEQAQPLNWILILKNFDFSLNEIKALLSGPIDRTIILRQLAAKRMEITSSLNEQIQKKISIDRLITIIEKEGFSMNQRIDLHQIEPAGIHEIKKSMPNMEMFLEHAAAIVAHSAQDVPYAVFRFDISHFKQVNDLYGFDVGDKVIVACFQLIETNVNMQFSHAAIGRAHGDEFIVFAQADEEATRQVAQAILRDLASFDHDAIGCKQPVNGYIGGLVGSFSSNMEIRRVIETSIDTLEHARQMGPNSYVIEPYRI